MAASKVKGVTKGKKGKSEPCPYFNNEGGCRYGQVCKAYHRLLKAEEYKCYVCGSAKHLAQECDRPKTDGTGYKGSSKGDQGKKGNSNSGSKGKSHGGKGKPSVNSVAKEDDEKQDTKSERNAGFCESYAPPQPRDPQIERGTRMRCPE